MQTKDGLVRIKWAGPNTPYFEIERDGQRVYLTKRELVSVREATKMFLNAYPEDFADGVIDNVDDLDILE